jgi:hypothetical protein
VTDLDRLEAQLAELQRRSDERAAELRVIAAELPAQLGRRAVVRMLLADSVVNIDWSELVRRARERTRAAVGRPVARLRRRPRAR